MKRQLHNNINTTIYVHKMKAFNVAIGIEWIFALREIDLFIDLINYMIYIYIDIDILTNTARKIQSIKGSVFLDITRM